MGIADAKFNIRKEYQALYGIGLVLAAYAAGQLMQGTGFLSAFFAGLAITLFNVTLCECFREYGEVTAEMLMLLAFVLFGAVLSNLMGMISLLAPIGLALILLIVIRPAALMLVLQRATMSHTARAFMGWFGPRGLSALLLALLVVQAHVPNAERLLAITGTVVVVSVVLHGITATPLTGWYGRRVATSVPTLAEEREGTFTGLFEPDADEIEYVNPDELARQMESTTPPIILDVRSRARYAEDEGVIPGSVRVLPDLVTDWAGIKPRDRVIVAYCSCPDDATSSHVARQLSDLGFTAAVLKGGYDAWRENYPIESKPVNTLVIS
jgi:rhodanese-related sulfurtransferase